jgi:hypothetical protein
MSCSSSRWRAWVSRRQAPKLQVGRHHARAAQHGANARQQLARGKRLGQVIVGAHLKAEDAVGLFVFRRQHQDRQRRGAFRVQAAAQRQAVLAGQHQVEHDHVDRGRGQHRAHLAPAGGGADLEAVLFEVLAQQIANFLIVVDDQYVVHFFHTGFIAYFHSGNPVFLFPDCFQTPADTRRSQKANCATHSGNQARFQWCPRHNQLKEK